MQVTVSEEKSAAIPIQIKENTHTALIDTGAARCCMEYEFFKNIPHTDLETIKNVKIKSATGQEIELIGKAFCQFKLAGRVYRYKYYICKGLHTKIIIGLDFLRKHRIGTTWTEEGNFALHKQGKILVQSLYVCFDDTTPILKTTCEIKIPPRSIITLDLKPKLDLKDEGRLFEVKPTTEFIEQYPNLSTVPILHKTCSNFRKRIPYTIINLTEEEEVLQKNQIVASMTPIKDRIQQEKEEIKVRKDKNQVLKKIRKIRKEKFRVRQVIEETEKIAQDELSRLKVKPEKAFVTSPGDVLTHRKVQLQDWKITEQEKGNFDKLCLEFQDVFSRSSEDIGNTPLITMDIDTGDNPPICQKPYNLALKHVEWVQKELEILEKAGIIVRSMSPWASPIVIVPKKSEPGEPPRRRMCVDYRMLNSLLPPVKKAHSEAKGVLTLVPLPKIDEIYGKLRGSRVYSALDMRSGYYHIELSEEAKPKTAFVIGGPHGAKYQFNRCPFGLTQAPAYFQALVSKVLVGIPFAFGYLDDILIYSPDIETHMKHLKIIFQRLREANLKLKASKCSFFKQHIQYLGHLISGQGIEPLPEKLQSVKEMPPPRTPKEIRQFLGLVGYYRKFIPRFADIARPLTNLTKKDVEFNWTEQCQKTFELLKEMLIKEPILKYPDPEKSYTLFTDASKYAWACVLTQEYEHEIEGKPRKYLHPITYVSGLFKGSQVNWATLTKEAFAIYMSIRKLSYYLEDADITLRSDHLPLKKFLCKNTLNTKVNNWAVEISPYRIQFEYIKGIKNTLADTMSRLIQITPDIQLEPEPTGQEFGYEVFEELQPIQTNCHMINEMKEEVTKDSEPIPDDLKPIIDLTEEQIENIQDKDKFIKNVKNKVLKSNQAREGPYYCENNILKKYVADNKQRFETIVLAPNCAPMLLKIAHDEMGHNGSARTYMILKRMYYWKGMKSDILTYVKQCPTCQKYNVAPVKYSHGHFSAPTVPMEFISMDLIGDFKTSYNGNKYALTVICMLTGYVFCIPIKTKKTAEVIKAYVDNVYKKFGGSRKILSDNGTEFKNQYFEKVAKILGVKYKIYTAPYHPQSNGRIEGFHHFLKACMSKHISKNFDWDEVIPGAVAAYNFFPNEHSRESPFFLMFGRDPRIPLSDMLGQNIRYLGDDESVLSLESLQQMYYLAAENIKKAREKMDKNKHQYPNKLKIGDMVMIKSHTREQFQPLYKGYFRIISFKGNQVQVRGCQNNHLQTVHISDVKYVLPADAIIKQIPPIDPNIRKSKLKFNPEMVQDLGWTLSTTLNTKSPIISVTESTPIPDIIEIK